MQGFCCENESVEERRTRDKTDHQNRTEAEGCHLPLEWRRFEIVRIGLGY
jgi:hypothetical protein